MTESSSTSRVEPAAAAADLHAYLGRLPAPLDQSISQSLLTQYLPPERLGSLTDIQRTVLEHRIEVVRSVKELELVLKGLFIEPVNAWLVQSESVRGPDELGTFSRNGKKIAVLPQPFVDDPIIPYVEGIAIWAGYEVQYKPLSAWTASGFESVNSTDFMYVIARIRTLAKGSGLTIDPMFPRDPRDLKEQRIRAMLLNACCNDAQRGLYTPTMRKLTFGDKTNPPAAKVLVSLSKELNGLGTKVLEIACNLCARPELIGKGVIQVLKESIPAQRRPKRSGNGKKSTVEVNPFSFSSMRFLLPSEKVALKRNPATLKWKDAMKRVGNTRADLVAPEEREELMAFKDHQYEIWYALRRALRLRFDAVVSALKEKRMLGIAADAERNLSDAIAMSRVNPCIEAYLPNRFAELDTDRVLDEVVAVSRSPIEVYEPAAASATAAASP